MPLINVAHACVTEGVNGPGARFTVWVQGCGRNCPGCFNPELQAQVPRQVLGPEELLSRYVEAGAPPGVTLSGGEPFDQAPGLTAFLELARELGVGVIAFSGYTLEELRSAGGAPAALLDRVDLLVDGAYRRELAVREPLRASANQRLAALSRRGEELRMAVETDVPATCQVLVAPAGEVIFTGFPEPEGLRRIRGLL